MSDKERIVRLLERLFMLENYLNDNIEFIETLENDSLSETKPTELYGFFYNKMQTHIGVLKKAMMYNLNEFKQAIEEFEKSGGDINVCNSMQG